MSALGKLRAQCWPLEGGSPVIVKYLEAIDIQDPNDCVLAMHCGVVVLHLDDIVDVCHNPAEETLVNGLQETQTEGSCLHLPQLFPGNSTQLIPGLHQSCRSCSAESQQLLPAENILWKYFFSFFKTHLYQVEIPVRSLGAAVP